MRKKKILCSILIQFQGLQDLWDVFKTLKDVIFRRKLQ